MVLHILMDFSNQFLVYLLSKINKQVISVFTILQWYTEYENICTFKPVCNICVIRATRINEKKENDSWLYTWLT